MARDESTFWSLIKSDATVISAVGTDDHSPAQVKVYASPAPEGTALPLVTYFLVSGAPENKLPSVPASDRLVIQVDVFSRSKSEVKTIARAVRDSAEPSAYMIDERDQYESEIMAHRVSMDFSYRGYR